MNSRGYTIIELLAVISILIIISGVITGILYSTLRGSNKVKITTELSQNGTYALSLINSAINDSRNITQVAGQDINDCTAAPSGTSLTLKRLDGGTTLLSCSNGTISSNSAALINTDQVKVVDNSCLFSCSQQASDPYAFPIITVKFALSDKNAVGSESQGSATFQTSASLNNYSP